MAGMRRKSLWIVFSLLILIILALASLLVVYRPRPIDLSYDASPQNVIIHADARLVGGLPQHGLPSCVGRIYPRLMVWGDGTVFYENWPSGQAEPSYWSGQLTSDQIHLVLAQLASEGFFNGWTPEYMNQGGQFLDFVVHLTNWYEEYTAQEAEPPFFTQLIEQITPQLVPVDLQTTTDSRITRLVDEYQTCVAILNYTPTPPRPTYTPIYLPPLPYPYPNPYPYPGAILQTPASTPTPTSVPVLMERMYQDAGLVWQECNLPYEDWQSGEDCLGVKMADWSEQVRGFFGYQQDGIGTITQTIGSDIYESVFVSAYLGQEEFALLKNDRVMTTLSGAIEGYDPNQSLINLDGKILWEFAAYQHETVIYDGIDLRDEHGLDAAYRPYIIGGKLILAARQGSKYYIVYDGQKIGPEFDKIVIAYCCEPAMYSIRRVDGEYWFWGSRAGQNYIVRISAIQ